MSLMRRLFFTLVVAAVGMARLTPTVEAQETDIVVRLSTTNQTTNTILTGAAVKNLGLLESELKKIDRLKGRTIKLEWSNFTTGPQMTNGMLGEKLDFAVMGDYPLVINSMTLAQTTSASRLIATAAFNLKGAGNAILVRSDSNLKGIRDLAGKSVAVAFGSSAYGMLLKALHDNHIDPNSVTILNQAMEVSATNLRQGKVDALAAYVPFADLLPFRGGVKKLYEGALVDFPTWHGIVVRNEFATKNPDIVEAYLRASLQAKKWFTQDPVGGSLKLGDWTGIEPEAVYLILGPGGVMTSDMALRPKLINALGYVREVLGTLGNKGVFDPKIFVDPTYVKASYHQIGLLYEPDADVPMADVPTPLCKATTAKVVATMQIWYNQAGIKTATDLECLASIIKSINGHSDNVRAAYVTDAESGGRIFGQLASFVLPPAGGPRDIVAFSRQEAAAAKASQSGGTVATFDQLMAASTH